MREQLNALVPVTQRSPDWVDVLARAETPLWRRPFVVAIAAALAALATAAAVTAALGGFDAWLSGNPGKPASKAEQQRFEAANGRSWGAFPTSTKLRELIDVTVDGKRYVLFGFKSGRTLCLKLKAISLGHSTPPRCAPVSTVARVSAPVVVVDGDDGFTDRHNHPSAEFSFGIAADGVSRVVVEALDGTHDAIVHGNAFLWVENEPNTGNSVVRISAHAGGRRTDVVLTRPRDVLASSTVARAPRGPTRVQRRIVHPRIAWYDRGERRGHVVGGTQFVKPDPLNDVVVGLADRYCVITAIGSTTAAARACSTPNAFFARGPLFVGTYGQGGEFVALTGAAADGVVRIAVFLADGELERVPLKHNLFASLVPWAGFPARVVAYDVRGRIVGIETVPSWIATTPRAATRGLVPRLSATGPNGTTATLRLGPTVRHYRCWRFGGAPLACNGFFESGPWIYPDYALPVGRDVFVVGHFRAPVSRVELRFANGDVTHARTVRDMFVAAIPKRHLSATRRQAIVFGLDDAGRVVQRHDVVYRASR